MDAVALARGDQAAYAGRVMRFSTLVIWTFWGAVVWGVTDMCVSVCAPTMSWLFAGAGLLLVAFVTSLAGEH